MIKGDYINTLRVPPGTVIRAPWDGVMSLWHASDGGKSIKVERPDGVRIGLYWYGDVELFEKKLRRGDNIQVKAGTPLFKITKGTKLTDHSGMLKLPEKATIVFDIAETRGGVVGPSHDFVFVGDEQGIVCVK